MNLYARIYIFLLGLAILAFVINQVRTRRLQERYALLWLLAGLGLAVAPLVIPWIDHVAYALGFDYPPALLLLLAVIALLLGVINVVGGYLVADRMLAKFKNTKPVRKA